MIHPTPRFPMLFSPFQDDKVFDRLMTDAEPMWRRTMEVTMAHAAQAKRQGSDSLRALVLSNGFSVGDSNLGLPVSQAHFKQPAPICEPA